MALAFGTQVGPYTVAGPLGAGGMGEVYRARDPRLGRDVALKLLPAAAVADADRLQRFEQEARAVAVDGRSAAFQVGQASTLFRPRIPSPVGYNYAVVAIIDGWQALVKK
jgi:serine/threonine protein kinase